MTLCSRAVTTEAVEAAHAIGIDIVQVSRIDASLVQFGDRFVQRLFSADEKRDAMCLPAGATACFAEGFAAKEAAIKAFGFSQAGVDWREIEVVRDEAGRCTLRLHGRAAELAQRAGASGDIALSLSRAGDYATAVVVASRTP